MKAVSKKIKEGVYWVGVLDWDIRKYHGYTLKGTSYNAYLVFGEEKVALIDNSYPGTFPELMARVEDAFGKEEKKLKLMLSSKTTWKKTTVEYYQNCTENSLKYQYTAQK
jgi:flavorubredoxin